MEFFRLQVNYRDGKHTNMEHLVAWRKGLEGDTLKAAAKLLGVSAVQVFRYEKGLRRIPAERVAEVSRVTGIPRHELRPDLYESPRSSEPPL